LRGNGLTAVPEVSRLEITPLHPRRKSWEMQATLLEKSLPVHAIECVLKIDFEKDFVWYVSIAFHPVPGGPDACFCAKG
jgi:hypothetical protein